MHYVLYKGSTDQRSLNQEGDFDEARTKLDYASSIDPDWTETTFLSGLLLAREYKNNEAALEIIAPIRENPGKFNNFVGLCFELIKYDMVSPLGDALKDYVQENPDEWIPHAMLGVTNFFVGNLDKSLDEFNTAMLLVPNEDVGYVFSATLRLSELSIDFKTLLSCIAPEWRDKLAQSAEHDTLLPALDQLVNTSQ